MSLKYTGATEKVEDGLKLLENEYTIADDAEIVLSRCENGFRVRATDGKAEIEYNTPTDLFRAMSFASDALYKAETLSMTQVPALKSCRKHGIENIFACLWGDDRAECDMYQALYGMQLYAESNYAECVTEEQLKEAFRISWQEECHRLWTYAKGRQRRFLNILTAG